MSLRTVDGDLAGGTLVRVPLLAPPLTRPLRAMWSGGRACRDNVLAHRPRARRLRSPQSIKLPEALR